MKPADVRLVVAVAGGFISGAALGALTTYAILEEKLQKKYEESVSSMQRVMEMTQTETPEAAVAELKQVGETMEQVEDYLQNFTIKDLTDEQIIALGNQQDIEVTVSPQAGELIVTSPDPIEVPDNDYQKAIAATDTPVELFVDGGINDYGVSYLEEEDYLDEDGRFKGKIDILMDGMNPIFVMDGQQIDDWDKRLGDSILVDFYRLVPPGVDRILYVRNHRTDEDYEVVWVTP